MFVMRVGGFGSESRYSGFVIYLFLPAEQSGYSAVSPLLSSICTGPKHSYVVALTIFN